MKKELPLALGILAAALALRLVHLADWPLWLDESWSRWMAERDWPGLVRAAADYDTHPPFYYALLKLWLAIAGAAPLALRLPSLLAGLATVALAWACARALDRPPGLAAALAAVSTPLVIAAHQARPYALFACAFALALWAALRLLRAPSRRLWLVYGLALEATLWLHSLGALFAAALAGALLLGLALEHRLRSDLPFFLATHALAGLAWLPAFLVLLEQRRVWTDTWLRFRPSSVPDGLAQGLAAPGVGGWLLLALAALGAAFLLRELTRRPAAMLLLAAALLPATATILLSFVSTPIFLPRTLVPSALPLLLLAAAGIDGLRQPVVRNVAAGAAMALLAIPSLVHVARPPEERWDALAAFLDRHVRPGDEIWLFPNELVLPLAYAHGGGPFVVPARELPAPFPAADHPGPRYSGTRAVPGMTEADADRLVTDARARRVRGIWLVSRMRPLFDPGGALAARLGRDRHAASQLGYAPLVIDYYRLEPPFTPPPG